jgi:hypothetical protein
MNCYGASVVSAATELGGSHLTVNLVEPREGIP